MSNSTVLHSSGIQPEILARFKEIFPEHSDIEEYLSNNVSGSSSSIAHMNNTESFEQDQIQEALTLSTVLALTSDTPPVSAPQNSITRNRAILGSTDSEMAAAIALSLRELRAGSTVPVEEGATSASSSHPAATPENVDTDNMSYEELQSLGDAIGTESKGLSKELIARFPTQKIDGKTEWFSSKKIKPEECVICLMKYEAEDEVLTLPCVHLYHNTCITQWLTDNKTCPVCNIDLSEATES